MRIGCIPSVLLLAFAAGLEAQSTPTADTPGYSGSTRHQLTGPELPDPLLAQAQSLVETGKLADAEHIAREYVSSHPNSADGHYLLGYILFREANAKSSLAEYTSGARFRKPTALDLEVVACDYVLLKDYLDADKWFTKTVEWSPQNVLAWYYLGRTKYNENRFDEAIAAFLACLKLDPKNIKAEDNLGLSYAGSRRAAEAEAAYKNAIAWQMDIPNKNSGPYLNLGILLSDNNRPEEALPYLRQAVQISPLDAQAHTQLGKAFLHLNQLDKTQAELEKAVQLSPKDAPLRFMLGQVYRREGLKEKAKQELDRYADLNAAHPSSDAGK
jgi:tetratricopeptide (TPR) repeat protein